MTLGALNRQMRELEDRFTELSTQLGERKGDGSAFTDEQTKQIKALIEERAALFRLVLLSLGSIATLAASLVFAYFKFRV